MKAFSSLPALSALALALGVSGAYGQSSSSDVRTAPVTPPASSTSSPPAGPSAASPSGASSAGPSSPSADSAASDRTGTRYGRGYRAGPGMMGGYGPGYGGAEGYGPGHRAYGPGMMGGYGPGYGMGRGGGYGQGPGFGGPGQDGGCGWGMGPGMMGGSGWGMGPGMMGGPGWGMGPGMMGGAGPGWGRGMMGPWGAFASLDLDDAQRKQLRELQQQQRRKHWALMGQMHDEMEKLQDAWDAEPGARDRAAILAANRRMADLRQQMLESRLDAAEQFDKILTPEQREQQRSQWESGPGRARR